MDILFPLLHISPEAKPRPFPSCGLNPLSRVTVGTSEFLDALEQTMWHTCQPQAPKHGTCMWNVEHVCGQAVSGKFSYVNFYQILAPRSAPSCHHFCPGLPASASPHCWLIPRDTGLNGCFCSFWPCPPDLISYACQRVAMQTQLPGKRQREHLSKCEPFHTPVRQRMINSIHLETFIWGLERLSLFEVTAWMFSLQISSL